jgi:hypothetical protein
MMKAIFALVTVFFLAACNPGGSSPGRETPAPPGPANPTSPVPQKPEPRWGELPCQIKSRCANPILNAKLWELTEFLKTNFAEPLLVGALSERRQVACGRKSFQLWEKQFPTSQPSGDAELADFFMQVLDITNCVHVDELEKNLIDYFKNTREYKNEIR